MTTYEEYACSECNWRSNKPCPTHSGSEADGGNMRKKFKIMYPQDHHDPEKAGKAYRPPAKCMVVMNSSGIFFQYNGEEYYPSIKKLSDVLPKYDVVWK